MEEAMVNSEDVMAGSIMFNVDGVDVPVLELRPNGVILVKGQPIADDVEVYEALKEFVAAQDATEE
jgi:hypothetical protein